MIISKSNLQIVNITKHDKNIPIIDNVHISKKGYSVAIGNKVLLAVSPVKKEICNKLRNIFSNETEKESKKDFTISSETVKTVLKNMPADIQFKGLLEHCSLSEMKENENEIKIQLSDGKRKRDIIGKLFSRDFLEYRGTISKALESSLKNDNKNKFVFNLKRFLLLLNTIEKVAPDKTGDNPVFVEFTNDNRIVIRCINMVTGQRVIGIMSSYDGVEGKWIDLDSWEKSFLEKKKKKPKLKLRLKKK